MIANGALLVELWPSKVFNFSGITLKRHSTIIADSHAIAIAFVIAKIEIVGRGARKVRQGNPTRKTNLWQAGVS